MSQRCDGSIVRASFPRVTIGSLIFTFTVSGHVRSSTREICTCKRHTMFNFFTFNIKLSLESLFNDVQLPFQRGMRNERGVLFLGRSPPLRLQLSVKIRSYYDIYIILLHVRVIRFASSVLDLFAHLLH